ncbi:MAG: NADPH:quinone reductase [Vezdaea aestivalis]|nr:MAG: NADPH:quinone reductase [Vezdaea aestivalis]
MASTHLPSVMHGIQVSKPGGPVVLVYKQDLPIPSPKEDQVLIKNDFAGINYIDTYFRTGLYPFPTPGTLGLEGAGTIVSLGGGSTYDLAIGDRVAYLGTGTDAGYSASGAQQVMKLPDGISTETGAGAILQGLTALTLIRESYHAQKGDIVLVHAAAGGMGLWLCQLLRAVGARVVGTASTEAKRALARENGAEWVFGYDPVELEKRVLEITDGKGIVGVYDGVGKDTFDLDIKLLARKGTLVSFGNASGPVPPISLLVLSSKNLKVTRPRLYASIATREEFEGYASELFALMKEHNIKVQTHEIYPLRDTARAHADLESRKTTGKLLLKI